MIPINCVFQSYSEQAAAALEEYKKKFEEYAKNTDIKVIKEINKYVRLFASLLAPVLTCHIREDAGSSKARGSCP